MAMTEAQKARAKAYRAKLMQHAKAGGYTPSKKGKTGTGKTIKKTSKTGNTYYYQPWDTLSPSQKRDRLDYAKRNAAKIRAEAAAYRREHGV